MRNILLILTSLLLVSCGYNNENTAVQKKLFKARDAQPFDTLICVFVSNTGSLDLYYLQGKLTLPLDIKSQLTDTLARDIKVCGNFPKDLIDMGSLNFNSEFAFKIIGKTILADTIRADLKERVPLFYVAEYTKFYYDYQSWIEKGDVGSFPNRKKMVDDVLKYLKLNGQTLTEIKRLFGQPDYTEKDKISYQIDAEYGADIDPIRNITLAFTFNQDSTVTEARKVEWKRK